MNRKIIALLSLLIVVAGISAVSAIGFDDLLGGGSDAETITLDGIDFNIPSGFEEDASYSKEGESASVGSVDYTITQKVFEKGSVAVSILVADYGENKVTDDIIASLGGEKETVEGIDGYSDFKDNIYIFSYAKDDKLVTITSTEEDIIGDFLIAD